MNASLARDLAGQTAMVTDTASEIGRAAALHLSARGATIVIHDLDVDRGVQLLEEIELSGERAIFVPADIQTVSGMSAITDEATDIQILVDNSGFSPSSSPEGAVRHFPTTRRSIDLATATLAPKMAARGAGGIVTVFKTGQLSDVSTGAPTAQALIYTQSLARKYGAAGVRANGVAIEVDRPESSVTSAARAEVAAIEIGSLVSPDGHRSGSVVLVRADGRVS